MQARAEELRVETARLVLRRLIRDDFDSLFQMAADSKMWRFPKRAAMSSEEAWSLLLRHEGSWTVTGYGAFAIEEKAGGAFVGLAGFSDFHRQIDPDFDPYPEITWSIVPWAQGLGYATEAAQAAIAWLPQEFLCTQSVCLIHSDNLASLAVASKLGYEPFSTRLYKDNPSILLRRTSGLALKHERTECDGV